MLLNLKVVKKAVTQAKIFPFAHFRCVRRKIRHAPNMKNKKTDTILIFAAAIIAVIAITLIYPRGSYAKYSSAFDRLTKVGSNEYDTFIKVSMEENTITAKGNLKICNINTDFNFINAMSIKGQAVTQFCDGTYIYQDNGIKKTKFRMNQEQAGSQKSDFNINYYIEELCFLIDANTIKELNIASKLSKKAIQEISLKSVEGGTEYEIDVVPRFAEELFAIIKSQSDKNTHARLKKFDYLAMVNDDGYVSKLVYKIDMDVTFPPTLTMESENVTKNIKIILTLNVKNPGLKIKLEFPPTNGYTENSPL